MEKVARFLSPVFHRVFPELRKDHPAYGFMTLNFAANFLGLDSAATPFGLKAMESMQEDNPNEGPRDEQPDHVPVPACGGTDLAPHQHHRLPRGAGRGQPGGHHDPHHHHQFAGTLAALFMVAAKQRINLFNWPVMLGVLGISGSSVG
jgi:spore maturation protein SpmA